MKGKARLTYTAYRGKVLTLGENSVPGSLNCQVWDDGCLIVDPNGTIEYVGASPDQFADTMVVHDLRPCWILPSFIDSHIHFCQLDLIGCYAGELLQWLDQHTFPHEQALMEDQALLRSSAQAFVDQLLIHGTSFACIYGPSQLQPTKILLEELALRGIRAIVGKTSMDRNAPQGLLDSVESDCLAHEDLYQNWHNHRNEQRLYYAITPRFAPSCSDGMMQSLADFIRRYPDVFIQTHYAENLDEIRWIHELYPQTQDYLAVYENFGMIGEKTLLGHGVHVSPDERRRLSQEGATIVHCPTSNMFLGSGLCPVNWLNEGGVKLSLGTDIGAGTSFSLWQTMAEAYKVAKLRGESLRPEELFYLATLGAADHLGFRHKLGSLSVGKQADFQVIDPRRHELFARRLQMVNDIDQLLFAFIHHCEKACVLGTYVDGQRLAAPYTSGLD